MPEFLPDLPVMLAFALAALAMALTPGPDMALFVSRTIQFGTRHGFATLFGAITGIAVHTLLAAFGISVLIITAPTAFWVLKIASAAYLLWLAIGAFRARSTLTLSRETGATPGLTRSWLAGLGINLTNPKIALFFVTFLPQFVSVDDPCAAAKLIALGIEFVLVSLPVVIAIVLLADRLVSALKRSTALEKALNWSFGVVFMVFSATILATEVRR